MNVFERDTLEERIAAAGEEGICEADWSVYADLLLSSSKAEDIARGDLINTYFQLGRVPIDIPREVFHELLNKFRVTPSLSTLRDKQLRLHDERKIAFKTKVSKQFPGYIPHMYPTWSILGISRLEFTLHQLLPTDGQPDKVIEMCKWALEKQECRFLEQLEFEYCYLEDRHIPALQEILAHKNCKNLRALMIGIINGSLYGNKFSQEGVVEIKKSLPVTCKLH